MPFHDKYRTEGHIFYHSARRRVNAGWHIFPHSPLAILCLALLNAVLLIAAITLGYYCGNVSEAYAPLHQDATELLSELNHVQAQHAMLIKAQEVDQSALETEASSHQQTKLESEQQKSINDGLQSQIQSQRLEKTKLLSNKSDIMSNCGHCPSGWHLLNSSCYYHATTQSYPQKNWYDSRADCKSRGADLVVIDSWEEQQLLFEDLPKVATSFRPWWSLGQGIWIGITDMKTETTWVWVNNVTQQGGFWMDGEPNDHSDAGEDCGVVLNRGNPRKTWFDAHCENHRFEWLCEMAPK